MTDTGTPAATPPATTALAYELAGVAHVYPGGGTALEGIDLAIAPGEHVAIVGANGSGKSTLLKLLDGLVFPDRGTVASFGRELTEDALEEPSFRREFRGRVGFVFQDADVQLFCTTVFDELAFGPLQLGLDADRVRARVDEIAAALRIDKLLDRAPWGLSGGEKKRVAIASVLTMHPDVLLLDEPTNALDPRSQVWLVELLADMKGAGATVVVATHDLSIVEDFADRVVALSEEHRVAADGTVQEVLDDRDLLLAVNLIHEHAHRHGSLRHEHVHGHSTGHDHGHA